MKVKWQSDAPNMELVVPKGQYLPYELPVATKEVLGGVKVDGDTINITSDGVISTQKVDLSGVATKVELEEVENKIPDTSGLATKTELTAVENKIPDVSDFATKDEIPNVSGLATKVELNEVAATIPSSDDFATKVELNAVQSSIPDTSGLATKVELSTVEAKIPDTSGLATKVELQTVEGSIPSEYLKNASVADNKLTITKSSGDTIEFSGGSGGSGGEAQLNYNISSRATFTEQDKEVIKSAIKFGTGFFIDSFNVIRIMSIGSRRVFIILKVNGATDNHIVGYQVDIDADMNVTSNVFTTFIDYVLVGSNSAISGDIITSNNWNSYIDLNANDWIKTTKDDSNLYNAKQLWVMGMNGDTYYAGLFRFDYSDDKTVLGDSSWVNFSMGDGSVIIFYNGLSLTESTGIILAVYYKT